MGNTLVKITVDDDGCDVSSPVWHLVDPGNNRGCAALCTGEFFGGGESSCVFETRYVDRGIPCDRCREMVKAANGAVDRVIKAGILVRPSRCDLCAAEAGNDDIGRSLIRAVHTKGYEPEFHLDVVFMCPICVERWKKFKQAEKREVSLTLKELKKFFASGPPSFKLMKIAPKNKTGFKSKIHMVVSSDHMIHLLRYRRGFGDALCKTRAWFGEFEPVKLHSDTSPDDFVRDVVPELCPRCVEMAHRLMKANKFVGGKVVRYLEERHV